MSLPGIAHDFRKTEAGNEVPKPEPNPGPSMPLTEVAIRGVKVTEKTRKLFDEKGLYLLVTVEGSRLWRLKYRWQGREKLLSLGLTRK